MNKPVAQLYIMFFFFFAKPELRSLPHRSEIGLAEKYLVPLIVLFVARVSGVVFRWHFVRNVPPLSQHVSVGSFCGDTSNQRCRLTALLPLDGQTAVKELRRLKLV